MRSVILVALLLSTFIVNAQRLFPGSVIDNSYRGGVSRNFQLNDSTLKKKWFTSKYSGISTTFSFYRGGNAMVVSAPLGLQLNRRINDNLFAFAGVAIAPSYLNFSQSFMSAGYNKSGQNLGQVRSNGLGIYSRAELGLQYINDERTFSISGSIGIERSSYAMPYYNNVQNKRIVAGQ